MKKKIYILHGWAYSTEKWGPFIDKLKEKYEPVLLKVPGLTEPLNDVWNLDNYVDWLNKKIGDEKTILLGHSNGGRIILAFAIKFPEKVSQIIIINSAGIYHNEFTLQLKRFVFGLLAKVGKNLKDIQIVKSIFYRFVREHDYEKANPTLQKTMRNLINSDLSEVLQQISVPTTIIWGENDKITPLKDGEFMHRKIKNSKLYIIKNARHSPQFSHVKEVTDIVVEAIN